MVADNVNTFIPMISMELWFWDSHNKLHTEAPLRGGKRAICSGLHTKGASLWERLVFFYKELIKLNNKIIILQ